MFELMRRSPFESMFQIHRELDDLVTRFFGHDVALTPSRGETERVNWWPAVESYSKDGNVHLRVALPGVDPKDVEVTVSDDYLTIRGERKNGEQRKSDVLYQGIAARTFERRFQLADGVQVTGAALENGLLHVDLVRQVPEAKKPKLIPIATNGTSVEAKAEVETKQAA